MKFDIEADELEIFLEEVNEHLQVMENGILHLEKTADPGTIHAIFRGAHTIKALAGTVGHHQMAELTHAIENLFDLMREDKLTPSQPVIDELLIALDVLKNLRDEFVNQEAPDLDLSNVLTGLRELTKEDGDDDQPKPPSDSHKLHSKDVSQAESNNLQLTPQQLDHVQKLRHDKYIILKIELSTFPGTFAAAARLMQATMRLAEIGEIITQHPLMASLADNQHDNQLQLLFGAKLQPAQVEEILAGIPDLAGFKVYLYKPDTSPSSETAKKAPQPAKQDSSPSIIDKTVRISVERLDILMNLVGELVTNRNRLMQVENTLRFQFGKGEIIGELGESSAHMGRIIDQLQEEVMRTRMSPISHLFDKFPRIVRDVTRPAGKQINLVIEGATTELDRSLIEAIGDPLIHLLRNAVDHGIDSPEERKAVGKPSVGTVTVTAAHAEGHIVITVEDDGRGIDPIRVRQAAVKKGLLSEDRAAQLSEDEAIDLIFQPNLSTAEKLTEVSGRGVGMDIVRTNVERLGGSVFVESKLGKGTIFRVTLPLTLAIMETMLVELWDKIYAVPLSSINDVLYLSEVKVNTINGHQTIRWRGSLLPLLNLREFFADAGTTDELRREDKGTIVSVTWGKQRVGLIFDQIIGKQGIVVKTFGPILGDVPGLSGCTILGDGRIALIVDVPSLINETLKSRKH